MQSRLFGVLAGVKVIVAPTDELTEVDEAYFAMASAGVATSAHREIFMQSGMSLTRNHGCESILLAGTDLAVVFGKASSQTWMSWHARKRMPRRLHWWP